MFEGDIPTMDVYEILAKPIVLSVMEGFNGTVCVCVLAFVHVCVRSVDIAWLLFSLYMTKSIACFILHV